MVPSKRERDEDPRRPAKTDSGSQAQANKTNEAKRKSFGRKSKGWRRGYLKCLAGACGRAYRTEHWCPRHAKICWKRKKRRREGGHKLARAELERKGPQTLMRKAMPLKLRRSLGKIETLQQTMKSGGIFGD